MRQLILAAWLLAACNGGGESPTAPPPPARTFALVSATGPGCSALSRYPIRGTLRSVSTNYRTNEMSIWTERPAVEIELPHGGAYRGEFWYGSNFFTRTHVWDFTINIAEGGRTQVNLSCQFSKGALSPR